VEFLRMLLNGGLFAELAPEFLFLLAHFSSRSLLDWSVGVCGGPEGSVEWQS
jgi:hypothetical protein